MKKWRILSVICVLALAGVGVSEDSTSPADDLWQKLQLMERQGPQKQATKREEQRTIIGEFLGDIDKLCDEFIRQFPNDKRVWEAKLDKLAVGAERVNVDPNTRNIPALEAGIKSIVDAADAPKPIRAQAAFLSIELHARQLMEAAASSKLAEFDKELAAFPLSYPADANLRTLPVLRLTVYEKVDKTKYAALLKELADDKNPQIAAEAKRRLKAGELKTQPLDLKFTALDGTLFDIAKWRGKVVLVDFWATWCGPCRREIPNVVSAFKKLHPQGFEIVGISLDADKERLLAFTKEKEMSWPQYFDGKGWQNEISSGFGINGIPTMWLVDKKGFIRDAEASGNLEMLVTKLLAE